MPNQAQNDQIGIKVIAHGPNLCSTRVVEKRTPEARQVYRAQVGVLPVRTGASGTEVLLITSRETKRWIIPKGWPMKGRKDYEAAALEALEEAGVKGKTRKHPIGAYTYQKRLADRVEPCRVMVYRLDVEKQLPAWREADERKRRWFSITEAADQVSEPNLSSMILSLGKPRYAALEPVGES